MEFATVVVEFRRLLWSSGGCCGIRDGCREVRGGCCGICDGCRGVRGDCREVRGGCREIPRSVLCYSEGLLCFPSDIPYCILHNPSIPQRSDVR